MKAISIRAPWWWFILHAGKDIENRDWSTRFRGPVLIHASKWWVGREVEADVYDARDIFLTSKHPPLGINLRPDDMKPLGGHIVGRAEIVDCVTKSDSPWFFGRYGFVLRNAEPFAKPFPCKGALSLFDVDYDAHATHAVEEQGCARPSRS